MVISALGHALFAHHLLKHIAELCILGLLTVLRGRLTSCGLVGEEVPCPRVWALTWCSPALGFGLGDVIEGVRRGGAGVEELALGIVLTTACGVGEGEVSIVDKLELASSLGSLWGITSNAIRVRL